MKLKNPNKLFPLFLTDKLQETKVFYRDQAGFRVTIDLEKYLQVMHGDGDGPELCFMKPDAFPDQKRRPTFDGNGVFVSVPVPDADQKLSELQSAGVEIIDAISDKPWGWRSFIARDPNGVALDFFHVYKEVDPSTLA